MGDDGDFGNRLGVLFQGGDKGVTHLVVSHQPLFRIGQHGVLLFGTGNDGLEGDQQVFLVDGLAALADSPEGGLVDQIGQVCAHGAGGGLGDLVKIHILRQADLPGVDFQGVQTALEVGTVHDDPAVKPAGTQQRLVQDLGPVGGGQADNALGGLETINFGQQLV